MRVNRENEKLQELRKKQKAIKEEVKEELMELVRLKEENEARMTEKIELYECAARQRDSINNMSQQLSALSSKIIIQNNKMTHKRKMIAKQNETSSTLNTKRAKQTKAIKKTQKRLATIKSEVEKQKKELTEAHEKHVTILNSTRMYHSIDQMTKAHELKTEEVKKEMEERDKQVLLKEDAILARESSVHIDRIMLTTTVKAYEIKLKDVNRKDADFKREYDHYERVKRHEKTDFEERKRKEKASFEEVKLSFLQDHPQKLMEVIQREGSKPEVAQVRTHLAAFKQQMTMKSLTSIFTQPHEYYVELTRDDFACFEMKEDRKQDQEGQEWKVLTGDCMNEIMPYLDVVTVVQLKRTCVDLYAKVSNSSVYWSMIFTSKLKIPAHFGIPSRVESQFSIQRRLVTIMNQAKKYSTLAGVDEIETRELAAKVVNSITMQQRLY
jgi:myosin heavy subunit